MTNLTETYVNGTSTKGEEEQQSNVTKRQANGGVAQLGEHLPCKQGVRSSILLVSTIIYFYNMGL